jgi:hypothetical protein
VRIGFHLPVFSGSTNHPSHGTNPA